MKLFALLKKFRSDESGAVTVDWVVLTAAVVGLGLVVYNFVGTAVEDAGSDIADAIGTHTTTALSQ